MDDQFDSLLNDNRSGSTSLHSRALQYYRQLMVENHKKKQDDLEALYRQIQTSSKTLIKKHPNIVLLRKFSATLLNYFKRLLKSDKPPDEILDAVDSKLLQIRDDIEQKEEKIALTGSKVIANYNKVMTISNSTLVRSVLLKTRKQKRRFEVYTLKSHPPDEGLVLANLLAVAGIRTTVIADSAVGVFMPEMNLVMLGADRIYENGFINKAGSLALCLTANHYNIPIYLAAETDKILMENQRSIKQNTYPEEEVFSSSHRLIHVKNYYYERVPLNYIHKIICEDGVFETPEFVDWYLKE